MKTNGASTYACTICGCERRTGSQWFLVTESRWQDRLKVLQWHDHLAAQNGLFPVCSAAHVKELVLHWMTAGSLEYPFARVSTESPRIAWRRLLEERADVDLAAGELVGELAVHRESMQRALRDNPHSLGAILNALVSALDRGQPSAGEFSAEDEEQYAITHEV